MLGDGCDLAEVVEKSLFDKLGSSLQRGSNRGPSGRSKPALAQINRHGRICCFFLFPFFVGNRRCAYIVAEHLCEGTRSKKGAAGNVPGPTGSNKIRHSLGRLFCSCRFYFVVSLITTTDNIIAAVYCGYRSKISVFCPASTRTHVHTHVKYNETDNILWLWYIGEQISSAFPEPGLFGLE